MRSRQRAVLVCEENLDANTWQDLASQEYFGYYSLVLARTNLLYGFLVFYNCHPACNSHFITLVLTSLCLENGLQHPGEWSPRFCTYKLQSYPKQYQPISTHGLLFYNGYMIKYNPLQLAQGIFLILSKMLISETIRRMISRPAKIVQNHMVCFASLTTAILALSTVIFEVQISEELLHL